MTCPRCGMPALVVHTDPDTSPLVLTPSPTRLGLYSPDGTRLTVPDVARAVRTTGLAGHDKHACPPRDDAQRSLFDTQEA